MYIPKSPNYNYFRSSVSNRAEAQRFYGMEKLNVVERGLNSNAIMRQVLLSHHNILLYNCFTFRIY